MTRKTSTKHIDTLRSWLVLAQFPEIAGFASQYRRTLSYLTALTYDHDPLIAWRAVEAMGFVSAASSDAEYLQVHLRRFAWLLSDESGSIGWRAPEAMGEIIQARPDELRAFIPILLAVLDMEPKDAQKFLPGTLWAVARLGAVVDKDVEPALPHIVRSLQNPNPQVCGMAIWAAGFIPLAVNYPGVLTNLDELCCNPHPVVLYSHSRLVTTTIAALAEEAISRLYSPHRKLFPPSRR